MAEAECRRGADEALSRYVSVFDEDVASEEKALDAEHARWVGGTRGLGVDVASQGMVGRSAQVVAVMLSLAASGARQAARGALKGYIW